MRNLECSMLGPEGRSNELVAHTNLDDCETYYSAPDTRIPSCIEESNTAKKETPEDVNDPFYALFLPARSPMTPSETFERQFLQ